MTYDEAWSRAKEELLLWVLAVCLLGYSELAQLPEWATSEVMYGEHSARSTVHRDVMEVYEFT